jgi:pyocin large subunit-like protein
MGGEKEKCKQKEKYFSVKLVSITNTPKKAKLLLLRENIFKGNFSFWGKEDGECAVMASIVTRCSSFDELLSHATKIDVTT